MRVMDGIMAIPGVLLAIALMSLLGSDIRTVIVAITIPEVPRMARLVRSLTLTVRAQPYIQAAVTNGARLPRLVWRHVLPNVMAPVMVQSTYIFASAMILEAVLSFLGAGTPPDIPSWGNMLAEGRNYLGRAPWMLAFPGVALASLILSINLLGDWLRDALNPRLLKNLVVEFPNRRGTLRALDDISFAIAPGEILGVVGESGAGKSLTGAAIIGLLEPPGRVASGQILLEGQRIDNLPYEQMRHIRGRKIGAILRPRMWRI
eukprot:gene52377-64030_t